MPRFKTRRDACFHVGARGLKLQDYEASRAWYALSFELMEMVELDVPKFKHLLAAIRSSTIQGRQVNPPGR